MVIVVALNDIVVASVMMHSTPRSALHSWNKGLGPKEMSGHLTMPSLLAD